MKKFDKIDILVLLVTVGLLAFFFTRPTPPAPPAKPAVPEQTTASTTDATKPEAAKTPDGKPVEGAKPATPAAAAETFELSNPVAKFTFTTKGGGIQNATVLAAPYAGKTEQLLNGTGQGAIGSLSRVDGELDESIWTKKDQTETSVTFETTTKDGLLITKKWTMSNAPGASQEGPGYIWDLAVKIKNTGTEKFAADNFFLYAGGATQLQANDMYVSTGAYADGKSHEVKSGEFDSSKFLWFLWENRPAREVISQSYGNLTWLGVGNQYYSTIISPQTPAAGKIWTKRFWDTVKHDEQTIKVHGLQAAAGLPTVRLDAGQETELNYQVFTGPRSGTLLNKIGGERGEAMFYGWTGWLSKLFLWLLNTFNGWMGSFGLAIVLLTIVVRIVIWPLHIKATRSMKRMGLLAPMMTEIKTRYKDKPQTPENQRKQQMEMMGLYKDYGVSPLGGCLPLLLQMPIFFGYFGMLNHAVEMRGHSFLWAHDLTQPDTVAHIFGFAINPFPLLMTITMFIQMKLQPTPPTTDENQKMQMKIMKFMPFMFLLFCYGYASALALYWTVQNIVSIFQTYLVKRIPEPKLVKRDITKLPPVSGAGRPNLFGQAPKEEKPKGPQLPRTGGSGKSAFKDKDKA